ncbi:MAG: hypothetical protein IPP84_12935 [Propionivibrio sp.]|uniref:hypothetical protein n=1 Tax=Propionivibrio sp. TaxID=2212460 RepID=UPI0025FC7C18|nr:hypothetical protein [Propionivibrio sp.]MBL0208806.1 hypothetical protein [Propionivibrio sp.]
MLLNIRLEFASAKSISGFGQEQATIRAGEIDMSMKWLGGALLGLGAAIFLGGGPRGLPNRGFHEFPILLSEYRKESNEEREPTLEQKGAYYTYCCYVLGAVLAVCGALILSICYFFGE